MLCLPARCNRTIGILLSLTFASTLLHAEDLVFDIDPLRSELVNILDSRPVVKLAVKASAERERGLFVRFLVEEGSSLAGVLYGERVGVRESPRLKVFGMMDLTRGVSIDKAAKGFLIQLEEYLSLRAKAG